MSMMLKKKQVDPPSPSTPPKKPKGQTYRADYGQQFAGIVRSSKDDYHARCNYCKSDFLITHSGIGDVRRHCETPMHARNRLGTDSVPKITSMFVNPHKTDPFEMKVMRAEAMLTELMVKQNIPMSFADELTKTLKIAFPGK